jgi:hypothetical protein
VLAARAVPAATSRFAGGGKACLEKLSSLKTPVLKGSLSVQFVGEEHEPDEVKLF